MTKASFVIVGANVAGARAAQQLRRLGFDGSVTLIGAERHLPYERPPLSKEVLLDDIVDADLYLESAEYWDAQEVDLRLGQPVTALSLTDRSVELADGSSVRADKVLLCTGGRARTLRVPGSDLAGVVTLRTIDDARTIKTHLIPGARIVIVGTGFIGAEVAACAQSVGCSVTMVDIADVPFASALGADLGAVFGRHHHDQGVTVLTNVTVREFVGDGAVRRVVLSDGVELDADLVVVGVGLEPAVELAEGIDAAIDNGIVVDELCETTVPGVYAAGDVANRPDPYFGGRVRVEHLQNAQNQSTAAAASMLGQGSPYSEVPWFWSDQYDLNLQVAGHPGRNDVVVWRGDIEARTFSVFYVRNEAVVAVAAVNRPLDVRIGRDLIRHAAKVPIWVLGDEDEDLRSIARRAAATSSSS